MKNMKSLDLSYFSEEDVLYIEISKEKGIGDEEYQEDLILYRNKQNKVVSIEIQHFSEFKESKIKISEKKEIDLFKSLEKIRMLISLRDIMLSDPKQFEETLRAWGFQVIKEKEESPKNILIRETYSEALYA